MFISFEGTEGVGKTTLIRKIHQYFEQQGKQVVLTREPGEHHWQNRFARCCWR